MKNITEEPAPIQLLPNTSRFFKLKEGGHVQVNRNSVHFFWENGQAWHVPIKAPLESNAWKSKTKAEKEIAEPYDVESSEKAERTAVFMKDASRFSYTTPIPASKAEDRQPLDAEQARTMARILEEIRAKMGWAPLVHIWNERQVRNIRPPDGMKNRRNETSLTAQKPRVTRKNPEQKNATGKKMATRPPRQDKPKVEKPQRKKRASFKDGFPGLEEHYAQPPGQRDTIRTQELAQAVCSSPWFTEYVRDTLTHAHLAEPETHLRTVMQIGQKRIAEWIQNTQHKPNFSQQFDTIRRRAMKDIMKQIEEKNKPR